MFDLSASVTYRSLALNDAARNAAGGPLIGNQIEAIGWPGVRGVGYTEKRSRGDGRDASDVYLDGRRFPIRGTTYGATRGDAWDRFLSLTAIFTPTNAYNASLDTLGYLPLSGSIPTANTGDFPSGTIPLFINVRPLSTPTTDFNRDRTGGDDDKGLGIPWTVEVEARDPRVYIDALVEVSLATAASGSGTLANRGTYPTPLTFILISPASTPSTFHFIGGGADITITTPDLAGGAVTITLDGDEQTVVQSYLGNTTVEANLLTPDAEQMYPIVPAGGGAYSWTASANLSSGSKIRYYEAFI